MSVVRRLFAVRSVEAICAELDNAPPLKRVLTASSLTAIGLGSTIGTGIFILTGTVAANHTGPALTLALLIAAFGSALAAICYSEFAAMIPVSGSAYTYAYCTLGESVAWIIGWNLSLEYLMSASAVAVGWSQYVVNILAEWGIHFPAALTNAPLDKGTDSFLATTGAIINLPAVLIVLALGWILYIGIKESATANSIMVWIKVAVIVIFILAGISYIDTANWHPYLPANTGKEGEFGVSGLLRGTAIIFFSYVGFDAASTTARETRNPQRDVPLGILGALVISAILYVAMSAVLTGMVPYQKLGVDAPVAVALDAHPQLGWLGSLVKIGAVVGMTSVILMSMLGQPRIFLAMADDGLLPPSMRKVHPKYRTPHIATAITTILAAAIAGLFPLNILGELISMGILLAFTGVCIGVLVLRYTKPDLQRPFRVPVAQVTCVVGALICGGITWFLPHETWLLFLIWSTIGFSIYALYGYRNSRMRSDGK
ncbi:MAG TPA: amino acid permease [Steroidobacteraceae bacterium]|jgi:APA family basic amino acid/polyamine antiporter|nr:amino acid permease [Steroidobacteraceae bacterium]